MADVDWYRNETWSPDIEAAYFERLKRARSQRPQYLKIQAQHLAQRHPEVALRLIDKYFETGDDFFVMSAYETQAEALLALGNVDGAIERYKLSLERQRSHPQVQSEAYLDLSLLIARLGRRDLYDFAIDLLEQRKPAPVFNMSRFKLHAALALISSDQGDLDIASEHARVALANAHATHSGMRYHPDVGLVGNRYSEVQTKLQGIAGRSRRGGATVISLLKSAFTRKKP